MDKNQLPKDFFEALGLRGDMKEMLMQVGFGAVLGTAFLLLVYIGGLLAHLVSGM